MKRTHIMRRSIAILLFLAACLGLAAAQEAKPSAWRAATDAELKSVLPARAPVQQERIETEMRTASGITDGHGKFIAGVVMITAGYSAEGKYSHFFLAQAPIKAGSIQLPPGEYVFGYDHRGDVLEIKFYEAATGKALGEVDATLNPSITRVESFRIWPPADRSLIQIGRFTFSYQVGE
jgi:hypothetical protein